MAEGVFAHGFAHKRGGQKVAGGAPDYRRKRFGRYDGH